MKRLLIPLLVFAAPAAMAELELVPLDVESGYWESSTELVFSKEIDDMLKSLPADRRASMKEMIKSQTSATAVKTCITEDDQRNFDKQIMESMKDEEGCEMTLTESSGKRFAGKYQCDEVTATFVIDVLNSKKHVTEVVTYSGDTEQSKIRVTAEWKGNECPADALQ